MPDSEYGRVKNVRSDKQMKRVVGLPGEKIEIRNNQLYINDAEISEPFENIVAESDSKRNFGPITIPKDEFFVLGDNRPDSADSRYYDPSTIKAADIYSKVVEIKKGFYSKN